MGVSIQGPRTESESVSVSVDKIDNGYVTTKSRWNGDSYESSKSYSKDKPAIELEATAPVDPGSKVMGSATAAIKRARGS